MGDGDSGFDHKHFLKNLTQQAGVYQMFDGTGDILYVGKAKNLKKRLSSYFRTSGLTKKTAALVCRIASIQVTVTPSEAEALVLEHNLIKAQKPPFNILLRDDKSYPYILMTTGETHPRIGFHRGSKKKTGRYFGPFPNASAVRESLNFLQKTFTVRQCLDSVYKNRSRPCLLYQIGRCSGPCVDAISEEDYRADVEHTALFLEGKSDQLQRDLAASMSQAAERQEYERAAQLRDQIQALRQIQAQQVIDSGMSNLDVIACEQGPGAACIHILYVRQGRVMGSKSYFPKDRLASDPAELLSAFLAHAYLGNNSMDVPATVIVSHEPPDAAALSEAIAKQTKRQTKISANVRTYRASWLAMAIEAARQNVKTHIMAKQNQSQRFEHLAEIVDLDEINRIECFDISHSSGEGTVASCVVFDSAGSRKSDYRRFNIEGEKAGDDYAAMAQALRRRYSRLQKEAKALPELVLIDGGRGQVNAARHVLDELGITSIMLLGVAKGTTRKPGFETLIFADGREQVLDEDAQALHLIQQIRDEAHRFAITGHRQRRDKRRRTSVLQDIPGVGPKRRKQLLEHFGGMQEVQRASVDDLAKVPSISKKLAQEVYSVLHSE